MIRLRSLVVGLALAGIAQPALAQPQPESAPADTTAAPPEPPPVDERVIDDFEDDVDRYEEASDHHHRRMRSLLLREYEKRKAELEERYAEKLRSAREEKQRRQLEAIALLKKFIRDHPDHPQFTPDAMFRLGNIYLDVAEQEVEQTDITEGAVADYSRSLELWQRIVDEFPDYRQKPETLYLLAYYGGIEDPRRSLLLYLSLVCANQYDPTMEPPEPLTRDEIRARIDVRELDDPYDECRPLQGAEEELVRHAWVRGIGDHHFQEVELDEAIAAYEKVADDEDAILYAETIYKLAWSYYRRDFLQEAIALFDESVRLYDETIARGETPKLELREEALLYIAISFTDPWEAETQTNPERAFERVVDYYEGKEEPYVRDVWVKMGHAFMELGAYEQAARAYQTAIDDPWRLHPDNPRVHLEVIKAYRSIDSEDPRIYEAAEEIGTRYAPDSEWARANAHDRRAMQLQRSLARNMLLDAAKGAMNRAIDTQSSAEQLAEGDPAREAMMADADADFRKAIDLYGRFINEYPDSRKVYEASYFLAESQRAVGEFPPAINNYRFVIESREHAPEYFEDSAKSMVATYDAWVEQEQARGNLAPIEVYSKEELEAEKPFDPRRMPQLYQEQQQAWDWYMSLVSDPETASEMGLNAARVSYSHLQLDDATERYERVFDKFCGASEGAIDNVIEAKDTLLTIYEVQGKDDDFKAVNRKFIERKCGDEDAIRIAEQQNRNLDFNRSTEKLEDARSPAELEQAAEELYQYYKAQPEDDPNVATALYNAAIAYRKAGKPKTALYLIDRFLESGADVFTQSPYYTQAFLVKARANQDMYKYDEAAETYLELRNKARRYQQNGLALPPNASGSKQDVFGAMATDALYNGAVMRELARSFREAVNLYRAYERETDDASEKDNAAWSVARVYKSAGNIGNLAQAYDIWRKRYGNNDVDRYVQTYYDVAKLFEKKQRPRDAARWGRRTIDAWERQGSPTHTGGLADQSAARMAGEWALHFAEEYYNDEFVPYRRHERQRRVYKQLERVQDELTDVRNEALGRYTEIAQKYQYPVYTLAALVRSGDIQMRYGTKWSLIPPSKDLEKANMQFPEEEILLKYDEGLREYINTKGCPKVEGGQTIPRGCTDAAKGYWEKVLDIARRNDISNRWVRLARENLASEFPDQYEFQHQEIVEGTEEP